MHVLRLRVPPLRAALPGALASAWACSRVPGCARRTRHIIMSSCEPVPNSLSLAIIHVARKTDPTPLTSNVRTRPYAFVALPWRLETRHACVAQFAEPGTPPRVHRCAPQGERGRLAPLSPHSLCPARGRTSRLAPASGARAGTVGQSARRRLGPARIDSPRAVRDLEDRLRLGDAHAHVVVRRVGAIVSGQVLLDALCGARRGEGERACRG